MKQPYEIKQDYREAECIVNQINNYVKGNPKLVSGEDGETHTVVNPIFFEEDKKVLHDKATEQKGILNDNLKKTKTKDSKEKNISVQQELEEARKKLENNSDYMD